jgi:ribosomal protein L22
MADEPTDATEELQAQAEPEQQPAAEEQPAKPKARRSAKAKAATESAGESKEVAAKPEKKPRRASAKKAAEPEASSEAEEETEAAAEQAEPAKRRSRPQAEDAPEPAARPEPAVSYEGPVRVVRAHARHVRTSARKARLVCDHLRGKSVEEARAILAFNPRGVSRDWSKVLESAIANAENNHELLAEDLVVREAFADEGPTIKRFRPRARGRASAIRKRTSHLTITLAPERR